MSAVPGPLNRGSVDVRVRALSDRLEAVVTTGIPTDTRETLLAACDEWRAVKDELGRCPQESPYEVFPEEWAVFDRATAELVYRMRRWIKASLA